MFYTKAGGSCWHGISPKLAGHERGTAVGRRWFVDRSGPYSREKHNQLEIASSRKPLTDVPRSFNFCSFCRVTKAYKIPFSSITGEQYYRARSIAVVLRRNKRKTNTSSHTILFAHQLDEEIDGVDRRIVPRLDHTLHEKRNRHNSEQVGCHGQEERQSVVAPSLRDERKGGCTAMQPELGNTKKMRSNGRRHAYRRSCNETRGRTDQTLECAAAQRCDTTPT